MQDYAPATKSDIEALSHFVENVAASLSREIQELGRRFELHAARLDRHGGLLRGGSTQITRLVEWSDRVDSILETVQARLKQLEENHSS